MSANLVTLLVSGLAVAISALSLWIGSTQQRRSDQRGRMPVLVFQYDGRSGWLLRNIGIGPALNVVVACKHVEGPEKGRWFHPVRIPPLSRDGEVLLAWLGHVGDVGLGATYDDFVGSGDGGWSYTTTCGNDLSAVVEGAAFSFPEGDITAQWKLDE